MLNIYSATIMFDYKKKKKDTATLLFSHFEIFSQFVVSATIDQPWCDEIGVNFEAWF